MTRRKKIVTGVPPPERTFIFVCEHCGSYPATEETARKFMTKSLDTALGQELRSGAVGARLTFSGDCPKCKPEGVYLVEVAALRKRKVH